MERIEFISSENIDKYIEEMNKRKIIIVDVRNKDKFEEAHLKSAINISYMDIVSGRYILPLNSEIVVYCDRGGLSMKAARKLVASGYNVKNLVGGIRNYVGKNIVNKPLT